MASELSRIILAIPPISERAKTASIFNMINLEQRYRHYAARMAAFMDARNITGDIGSELIGAHTTTVYDLRRGAQKLDDEWRARVAIAFGIDHDVLFGEGPLPEPGPGEIYPAKRRGRKPKTVPPRATLSLYGLAAGSIQGNHSMTNDPVDEVPCPPALRTVVGAYAMKTRGDSMVPRFFHGERLYINPHQAVRAGDHVVIQVRNHESSGTDTWVKRYEAEDEDMVYVSQYNPPGRIAFKKKYVQSVHRVLPIDELFEE